MNNDQHTYYMLALELGKNPPIIVNFVILQVRLKSSKAESTTSLQRTGSLGGGSERRGHPVARRLAWNSPYRGRRRAPAVVTSNRGSSESRCFAREGDLQNQVMNPAMEKLD